MTKRPRTLPWRAALTDVACSGGHHESLEAHLPLVYNELAQPDPQGHPFEWLCPRCGLTAPSSWWDRGVPVPPHVFVGGGGGFFFVAKNWQCRVCLQASENRLFHPAPAVRPFDPANLEPTNMVEEIGAWAVILDESVGPMEAYVDVHSKYVVFNSETWQIVEAHEPAYDLIFGLGSNWRDGATGMRFLHGVPAFDDAVRKFRAGRSEDVVKAKDEITQLVELLESLSTQAVSLAAHPEHDPDTAQRKILMGRYLQARRRVTVLQERMEELESRLDLVAMGVMAFG